MILCGHLVWLPIQFAQAHQPATKKTYPPDFGNRMGKILIEIMTLRLCSGTGRVKLLLAAPRLRSGTGNLHLPDCRNLRQSRPTGRLYIAPGKKRRDVRPDVCAKIIRWICASARLGGSFLHDVVADEQLRHHRCKRGVARSAQLIGLLSVLPAFLSLSLFVVTKRFQKRADKRNSLRLRLRSDSLLSQWPIVLLVSETVPERSRRAFK